jgi:multidrug efflux pump subunit AcrA (membrane-fusion protein)
VSVLSDLAGRVPHARGSSFRVVNGALVAALIGLGALSYVVLRAKPAATQPTVRTAPVARGVVLSSVSASGTIASPSDLAVGFQTAGVVSDIYVQPGQHVHRGQVLARLDPATARSAVAQAVAGLAGARANLVAARAGETPAQRRADAVAVEQGQAQVGQANAAVGTARAQLAADQKSAAQALRQAQNGASIKQAQTQLRADQGNERAAVAKLKADQAKLTVGTTTYPTVDQAVSASDNLVNQDKTEVQTATQTNYDLQLKQTQDQQKLSSDQTALSRATSASQKASIQSDIDNDQATVNADADRLQQQAKQLNALQYQLSQDEATQQAFTTLQSDLAQDQSSIQSYEAKIVADNNQIDTATTSRTTAIQNAIASRATTVAKDNQAIASALQQVASAKLSLTSTRANNAVKAIVSPVTLAQDEASVLQAEASLETAQRTLAQMVLTAPSGGTVAAVNGIVGQPVSGTGTSMVSASSSSSSSSSSGGSTSSGLIQLVKVGGLQVTSTFSESDAARIRLGQPATVTVSALPNVELPAHVIGIDVLGTSSSGVVEYTVTLALDRVARQLKPGMSANATITTAERDNVLNVPSAAVTGSGANATVKVMQNGVERVVDVIAGLKGDTTTQILRGLRSGEDVVVSTVTVTPGSSTSTTSGLGGRFGGGFGGGGLGGGGFRVRVGGGG